MRLGFGHLALSPCQFWRMTPRELGFAVAHLAPQAPSPMRRAALEDLLQRFPDER